MSRFSRITIPAGCACLLLIAFLVFAPKMRPAGDSRSSAGQEVGKSLSSTSRSTSNQEAPRSEHSRDRTPAMKSFDQVESILGDQSADDKATAIKLIELAARSEVSIGERTEALSHAVLLAPDSEGVRLVALAQEKSLSPELGQILLSDFHNRPDPTRLAGAVALAKSADPSIRKEAIDLVRFLTDANDPDADDSEALRRAEAKLKN